MKLSGFLLLASLLVVSAASAIDPSIIRVNAQKVTNAASNSFGRSVALNETYLVVGESLNDDSLAGGGAVHVFNAVTGAWLRKLSPSSATLNGSFGSSVALSGKLAVIGASNEGSVYVFDVSTGKQLAHWLPLVAGGGFGVSVAASGDLALVGHTGASGGAGAVHVYDLKTKLLLQTLTASDGVAGDQFGTSVALDGKVALIGAMGDDALAGSAYLMDVDTGNFLNKLIASDQAAGDYFGISVAIAGGRSLVGAMGKSNARGAAYLFNNQTAVQEYKFTASTAAANDEYGTCVALSPSLAFIGSPGHDSGEIHVVDVLTGTDLGMFKPSGYTASQSIAWGESVSLSGGNIAIGARLETTADGFEAGTAYMVKGIVGPMPFSPLVMQGNYASGKRVASFAKLGEGFINEQAEASFSSTLSGIDSNGGKDSGVWSNLNGPLKSIARSRDLSPVPFSTDLIGNVTNIAFNEDNAALMRVTLTGTGLTSANNTLIGRFDAVQGLQKIALLGDGFVGPGSAAYSAFDQIVQSRHTNALGFAVRFKIGTGGTTATSDSMIHLLDGNSFSSDLIREGRPEPVFNGSEKYGQLNPRVAFGNDTAVWSAMRAGSSVPAYENQGIYRRLLSNAPLVVYIKNGDTPLTSTTFTSFLGESASMTNDVVGKSTITGSIVNSTSNQLLWVSSNSIGAVVAHTGDPVTGLPSGVKWKAFTQFWPLPNAAVLILGTVTGSGVSSANDQVLALAQSNHALYVLAREGDAAPGCSGARLGAITRVDSSMGGRYAFIASLTGAAADANLAMFIGNCNAGNDTTEQASRLPVLKVRKGTRFNTPTGTAAKVLSFSLPTTGTDATGAGNKGLGRAINNDGNLVFTLSLDDKTIQLVGANP